MPPDTIDAAALLRGHAAEGRHLVDWANRLLDVSDVSEQCRAFVLGRLAKAAPDAGNPFAGWTLPLTHEHVEELYRAMQHVQLAWMVQAIDAWIELHRARDGA